MSARHDRKPARRRQGSIRRQLEKVNKLWLVLSLFVIAFLLNFVFDSSRMVLGFYTLPTVVSAYTYGRRHATLTALASVLFVVLVLRSNPLLTDAASAPVSWAWIDIAVWGCTLVVTAYLMGTLYDHKSQQLRDLRESYHGLAFILRDFISSEPDLESHSYRTSVYASTIAATLGLDAPRIEDVRAAALLRDIAELDIGESFLSRAADLTNQELEEVQDHMGIGVSMLEPAGGSLRRILPIIVALRDRAAAGPHAGRAEGQPLEARVIAVAEAYDSLVAEPPQGAGLTPFEAKEIILKGTGTTFDPQVIEAFLFAFSCGEFAQSTDVADQEPARGEAAFATIVGHRTVAAQVIAEQCPPDGTPRATRYDVSLPVWYRLEDESDWRGGTLENISESGLLFRGAVPAGSSSTPKVGSSVELRLDLPPRPGATIAHAHCRGALARTGSQQPQSVPPKFAVAVTDYRTGDNKS